jgi:hypothetical protein
MEKVHFQERKHMIDYDDVPEVNPPFRTPVAKNLACSRIGLEQLESASGGGAIVSWKHRI